MGYRIMQLQYEPTKEEMNVIQGILLERPLQTKDICFATISSMYTQVDEDLEVKTVYEYQVEEMGDDFKNIKLYPALTNVHNEDGILLFIEYVENIKTSNGVQRIAGRYYSEGVFLLKPNDKIEIRKGKIAEEYVALKFEEKMYLVKVHKC